MIVYGINPVLEALRARRATRIRVARAAASARERGAHDRIEEALALAGKLGVPVERVDGEALDRAARGGVHQGIAADLEAPRDVSVDEIVAAAAPDAPLVVVLDGIEDPHNVGAILRTADAAGCHGIVRQARHAASLDGAAAKASAGAVAHVRLATVVNIARTVEDLKALGVWTVGLAGDAPASYEEADLTLPTALVLGSEGTGLRRLVRERCDRLVSIPMLGAVGSLNVSVAAGVALFEAVRQRRAARRRGPTGPGPSG
ncbi:MAG TPA: 23S rRNA (guanosine(2251)-2'-O)-methyltransferase RlmB [Vicinamibacterales bacterium]|jgi:23S rRNA (guanosine2251-2'-O)-methyltransferase|nr:23S rRNA (guanosine(2251)-2'-O)-methyltransferase RlmB [Vicinamibacterales bacterium]